MVDPPGDGRLTRQSSWPPARGFRVRQRAVIWPSPSRISWPLTPRDWQGRRASRRRKHRCSSRRARRQEEEGRGRRPCWRIAQPQVARTLFDLLVWRRSEGDEAEECRRDGTGGDDGDHLSLGATTRTKVEHWKGEVGSWAWRKPGSSPSIFGAFAVGVLAMLWSRLDRLDAKYRGVRGQAGREDRRTWYLTQCEDRLLCPRAEVPREVSGTPSSLANSAIVRADERSSATASLTNSSVYWRWPLLFPISLSSSSSRWSKAPGPKREVHRLVDGRRDLASCF